MQAPHQGNHPGRAGTHHLADIEVRRLTRELIKAFKCKGIKQRRAEDCAKVYAKILNAWQFYQRNERLQRFDDGNADTPGNRLGLSFFQSSKQFINGPLEGWNDKRFQNAVDVLRAEGLICTQVRGVSNASLGGKARHWWVVHPGATEARAWTVAYNTKADASNLARYHRGRNGSEPTTSGKAPLASDTTQNQQITVKSQPPTKRVLPKWEHRFSQNGSIGSPEMGDQFIEKESIDKNSLRTHKSPHAARDEHDPENERINEEVKNASQTPLQVLATPSASDTCFDVSYSPVELPHSTHLCLLTACHHFANSEAASGNHDGYVRRADSDRLVARARYLLNPYHGDEPSWTPSEIEQAISDSLSFYQALYSSKGRPHGNPFALLKKALSEQGAIYEPTPGVNSSAESTPSLIWNYQSQDFLATAPDYVDEAFALAA